jgi:hypothetical protein
MSLYDDETVEFVKTLQEWHERQTAQLNTIMEHKDADIELGDRTIAADSDVAKGIRIGVMLALHLLGKLPFEITCVNDLDDDNGPRP